MARETAVFEEAELRQVSSKDASERVVAVVSDLVEQLHSFASLPPVSYLVSGLVRSSSLAYTSHQPQRPNQMAHFASFTWNRKRETRKSNCHLCWFYKHGNFNLIVNFAICI